MEKYLAVYLKNICNQKRDFSALRIHRNLQILMLETEISVSEGFKDYFSQHG